MIILIVLLILLSTKQALAQQTFLEEIVVTATKIEEVRKEVPFSFQIINQRDIKTSVGKDAGDLIAESAVGHVGKLPGALTTFSVRGMGISGLNPLTSRTLLLVDGFKTATANIAIIPIDEIEKIEIVKGPASVLYGSSAMGGVLNILTKRPVEDGIKGYVGIEFGSWNRRKALGEIQFKRSDFDAYLLMSRADGGDYEVKGFGVYKNTGYNNQALSFKAKYNFLSDVSISASFRHLRGWEIGSPGPISLPTPEDYIDHSLNSFDIKLNFKNYNFSYYFSRREYEYHENMWGSVNFYKTTAQGVNLQKIFPIDEHRILIGLEASRVELENKNTPPPPFQPKSQYDNAGIYSEAKIVISKKLILTLGARYDYFENELLSTPDMLVIPKRENLSHFTIRGGALYKLTEYLIVRANAGTGFRAPSPDEYSGEYLFFGTRYIGNPSLKPEKLTNIEAGLNFSQRGLNSEFTFFNSTFSDKIKCYFDPALNAYTYRNIEKAEIQGFELGFSYDLKYVFSLKFSLEPFINLTYHTKRSDESGKTLEATPKWLGAFGIRAYGENWDARLIANYFGDENVAHFDPNTWQSKMVKKSNFTVVNFKALYKPQKNMELSFGIENLFDRAYEFVLDYPMPKRSFTGSIKWHF